MPFYSIDTKEHIASPGIYPRRIIHVSCHDAVELVNISRIVDVDVNNNITRLAFVFLASDVTNLKYHIQDTNNAFMIRYKYCPVARDLQPLTPTTFKCFPDLNPNYIAFWCKCLGRNIFMSIDYFRHEVWRFLCHYGQSQGRFLKAYLRIPCNPQFVVYMTSFFVRAGILSFSTVVYNVGFSTDCETKLETFAALLGDTALFGVQRKRSRKDKQSEARINDAINMLSKIELFISKCHLKV